MSGTAPQAVLTGASAGIGAALAPRLIEAGYDLVLVARRADRLEAMAAGLRSKGRAVDVVAVDVCEADAPAKILAAAPRLEVLINNAGAGKFGRIEEASPDEQSAMVRLNCESLTRLTTAAIPQLVARKKGVIVNLSSIAGFQPVPYFAVYAASKAYVFSLSQALDAELAPQGVRVVAVCPGPVPTEFQGIAGTPDANHAPWYWRRTPDQVADATMRAIRRPRRIVTPAPVHRFVRFMYRFLPMSWITSMASRSMKKRMD